MTTQAVCKTNDTIRLFFIRCRTYLLEIQLTVKHLEYDNLDRQITGVHGLSECLALTTRQELRGKT